MLTVNQILTVFAAFVAQCELLNTGLVWCRGLLSDVKQSGLLWHSEQYETPTQATRHKGIILNFPEEHGYPRPEPTPPDRIYSCYNRQGRKANVGAGTATATEPTREHKQYATQGPTTYLCT